MNPLAFLNPYRWLLAIGLVAALLLGFKVWKHNLEANADAAGYARAVAEMKDRELAAVKAVRAEELRRQVALEEVIHATKTDLAAVRAAADGAAAAGERLRAQLSAARRSCGASPGAVAASGSAPTDAAGDLLDRVQQRLDEAADGIARFADESRIAGQACERAYHSLTPASP